MRTIIAQLPDIVESDDKAFTTDNAVIVLDGASAFHPVSIPAARYAEHLGETLRKDLHANPEDDLRQLLSNAISQTAKTLQLEPASSPSSTVAIARLNGDHIDALALGDSPLIFPNGVFSDDRIDDLELPERTQYRAQLARGEGYTTEHRQRLAKLQQRQAQLRNRKDGYWIAETDPEAASHAIIGQHPIASTPWTILATDGAFNPIAHLEKTTWQAIAHYDSTELHSLLQDIHRWETDCDPHGHNLPRAKQHDDKTIAIAHWYP